ncbi:MAG: T9SS type A sorting domain-containing protein, partial [Bacteroidetes bacterium]|nr:T9SS type A sorting domain-containing protein [Bacteroidota bacterium]
WQTATELNNYGFEIERSLSDATDWQKIGFVPGSGNSYSPKQYSFVDENPPSAKISYRLKQIDFDGQFEYYGIIAEVDASALTGVEDKGIPVQYSLSQNYPNPFNPSTKINYSIPGTENVSVILYDLVGNEIRTLVNETKSAGNYEIEFDASYLASGVYYYKLKTSNFVQVRKMVLIK